MRRRAAVAIGSCVAVLVALTLVSCAMQGWPRGGWPTEVVSDAKDGGTLVIQGDEEP